MINAKLQQTYSLTHPLPEYVKKAQPTQEVSKNSTNSTKSMSQDAKNTTSNSTSLAKKSDNSSSNATKLAVSSDTNNTANSTAQIATPLVYTEQKALSEKKLTFEDLAQSTTPTRSF